MYVWLALISFIGVAILILCAFIISLCIDDTGKNKSHYKANKRAYKRKEEYANLYGLKKCPLCLDSAFLYKHDGLYTPCCIDPRCPLHFTTISFATEEDARMLWNSLHRSE